MMSQRYVPLAIPSALGIGLVLVFQACAWFSPEAVTSLDALLLSPVDFANTDLREMQRLGQRETRDGGQTAQVALQNDRSQVYQSVVAFPSENAARKAFETLRQERPQDQWKILSDAPTFAQESVVLLGKQGDQEANSVAFRQKQLLVRLNVIPGRQI